MNELDYADKIIKSQSINNIFPDIPMLMKYYLYCESWSDSEIINNSKDFLFRYDKDFNKVKANIMIENMLVKAKKYPLCQINSIPITKQELNIINNLNTMSLRLLAFTLVALGKFYNLRNENNNNWCNVGFKELFQFANTKHYTQIEKSKLIHQLKEKEVISTSENITSLNIQINIIDNSSNNIIYKIDRLDNIGNTYKMLIGKNYKPCSNCGKVVKALKNQRIHICKNCK